MSSKCPGQLEAENIGGLTVFRIGPDGPRYKVRCALCGFAGEVGSLSSRMVCGSRVRRERRRA